MSLDRSIAEAARLREQGRFADAAKIYARIVREAPSLATCWYNLGFCLRHTGRFEEALDAYQKAIDRGVSEPEEAHLNRAVILTDQLRRAEDAERELRRAIEINPRYAPAYLNLANMAEDAGRREDARGLYERLLAFEPEYWTAVARYASLRAGEPGMSDALRTGLERALARPDVGASDKSSLAFALGEVLDRAKTFDAAFAAYDAANAYARASTPIRYDRRAQTEFVDRLIGAFAQAAPKPESAAAWSPVFVCGMFRSGSTLTEQILAGHPRITALGEFEYIPGLVHGRLAPFPQSLAALPEKSFAEFAGAYEARVRALYRDVDVATDKRPDNFLYLGLLKRMFPAAKIVHTTRNPLDNILSIYFLNLDAGMSYATALADIAHHYREYRRLMAHWRTLYGDDILDFDYDAFVREPEINARRLTDFLGLDWREECLAFHKRTNLVKTASVWQVREPLYTRSSGRWRNYERQMAPVRELIADMLAEEQR